VSTPPGTILTVGLPTSHQPAHMSPATAGMFDGKMLANFRLWSLKMGLRW